ncbi:MAG TPA: hypothetical protein PKW21_15120 [Rhabdaerophilum sp.]|nr:hypothetical protein [Rhabdaerophilum sp.]
MLARCFFVSFVVIPVLPALAQQPRSIVGTWRFPGEGCKREQGAITIRPMELESEDVLCKFRTVKREGNTVTWTGVCGDVEAGGNQRVTATETAKGLTIRYHPGGNVLEGLQRCPR